MVMIYFGIIMLFDDSFDGLFFDCAIGSKIDIVCRNLYERGNEQLYDETLRTHQSIMEGKFLVKSHRT
jgi:hypothetical protein